MFERAGAVTVNHALHEGSPLTRIQWHFMKNSSLPVAVHTWDLPAGASEGLHVHPATGDDALEEFYILVSGSASMSMDGVDHQLRPGDSMLAKPGIAHDFRNTGADAARVIVVWGRPGTAMDWTQWVTGRKTDQADREAGEDVRPDHS
ncbi:cupin domain-containing protein [Rhodococcus pseudokoreensis]|uniref:Cupin domain-containing protein n=1 Tax=Rhodococcus pseudokoreensis TaxID=2811421 RepID=A0A974ZW55_9NOCA|nr:cupin domain-containing protein [Rhodococcus pseudokoreensis]QSE92620.1 cupin domain-containing protein [Rhodococcus pseudokoreensis]